MAMLASFEIEGFRCFRRFEIRGLWRINLIAGKNSVGKSALLEAIRLYQRPGTDALLELLDWRDEIAAGEATWTWPLVEPLFSDDQSRKIRLAADRRTDIRPAWHRREADGRWIEVRGDAGPVDDASLRQVLRFEIPEVAGGPFFFLPLDGSTDVDEPTTGMAKAQRSFVRRARLGGRDFPGVFLRTGNLDTDAVSDLFERIVGTELEDEVTGFLRWVVPDAERLVTKGSGDERLLYVKRKGARDLVPIKRFGGGAARLAALALAICNSRDGWLLIDEIENGIHYELFDQLWDRLSRMSKVLNVQVFASTHSKDCIEAFERSFRLPDFDACFYRFERSGDDIRSVRLDHASFFSVVAGQEHQVR